MRFTWARLTWKQAILPTIGGIAVGVGVTVAFKYGIGAHAGVTAWLQAVANASLVVAAFVAGLAALIARQSFLSQEGTAHRQFTLANEEAARQIAADEHERHHKSMTLILRFVDDWNSDKMLRWRSELAVGLLKQVESGGPLSDDSRLALGEIADFIDLVGYCVLEGLVFVKDAWDRFSYFWEVYWEASSGTISDALGSPAGAWANAEDLLDRFAKLETDGQPIRLDGTQLRDFLLSERDIAAVEETVLARAERRRPAPRRRASQP